MTRIVYEFRNMVTGAWHVVLHLDCADARAGMNDARRARCDTHDGTWMTITNELKPEAPELEVIAAHDQRFGGKFERFESNMYRKTLREGEHDDSI